MTRARYPTFLKFLPSVRALHACMPHAYMPITDRRRKGCPGPETGDLWHSLITRAPLAVFFGAVGDSFNDLPTDRPAATVCRVLGRGSAIYDVIYDTIYARDAGGVFVREVGLGLRLCPGWRVS